MFVSMDILPNRFELKIKNDVKYPGVPISFLDYICIKAWIFTRIISISAQVKLSPRPASSTYNLPEYR